MVANVVVVVVVVVVRRVSLTSLLSFFVVVPGTEQLDGRYSAYCMCNNCIWDGDR